MTGKRAKRGSESEDEVTGERKKRTLRREKNQPRSENIQNKKIIEKHHLLLSKFLALLRKLPNSKLWLGKLEIQNKKFPAYI